MYFFWIKDSALGVDSTVTVHMEGCGLLEFESCSMKEHRVPKKRHDLIHWYGPFPSEQISIDIAKVIIKKLGRYYFGIKGIRHECLGYISVKEV